MTLSRAASSSQSALSQTDYATVVKFGADTGGATFDLLGFCIDLFHPIQVGIGSQLSTSLSYTRGALTHDSNGTALSNAQVRQIGGLATIGFDVARGDGPDKASRLAAIQQAIWTIEYPTIAFTAGSSLAGQQGFADAYLALAPSLSGVARVIYANDRSTQGFLVAGVPEPGTWAMLIAGFGMVGVMARRRARMVEVTA